MTIEETQQYQGQPVVLDQETPAPVEPAKPPRSLLGFTERWALLGLLIVIALFFSVFPKSSGVFPTEANLAVITGNQAVVAVIALSIMVPLIAGHFDFSVGANAAFASLFCAALMSRHNLPLALAVLLTIVVAMLISGMNGVLIAVFKTNSFITTLGVATFLGGLISWYSNDMSISTGISKTLTNFGGLNWLGIPRLVYLVVLMMALTWYLLGHTPFGRRLYAVGSNTRAARLVGMRVEREVITAFLLSGFLAGVAGVLTTARNGGATTDTGTAALFGALAAVFLGITAVTPGRFNVIGTGIGVLFVAVSVSGLTLSGASDWVQPMFNGASLLVAVILSTYLARRRRGVDAF